MGFEYDLAKEFAAFLQVELEVITPGWNEMFSTLEAGRGDFIASGLTMTENRSEKFLFTQPYMEVQQKYIYHKSKHPIKKITDLNGKTIHVRRNTSYHDRLKQIKADGIDIKIVLHDNIPSDELICMVADKTIPCTIADSNIAMLNQRYYPDIRIGISLNERDLLGWAVQKDHFRLADTMVEFFEIIETTGFLEKTYEKYYGNGEMFDYFDLKKFHERIQTRLPKYKPVIIRESRKNGFDWRMIAAVAYQESHLNPRATSFTGVKGLMQVTRRTAREMGIKNRFDPEQSLIAGIGYLKNMYEKFHIIQDHHERLKFALASYNIGYGHVLDAQRLAEEQGLDKNRWASLAKTLPLLTKRKYYKKTRYGYARGREPVKYIKKVFTYFDILKQKV